MTKDEKLLNDMKRTLRNMLKNFRLYFDKYDRLNSEGRALLCKVARIAAEIRPELLPRFRYVLKSGSLNDFIKLAREILGEEEIESFTNEYGVTSYQ
ncbi:MAG: hypothetical protein DRJ40_07720 [Thermoprotei archaeon]|nr:MAG: hypothetical protein DRJ40_07720 [Thermoprotei archaeon]